MAALFPFTAPLELRDVLCTHLWVAAREDLCLPVFDECPVADFLERLFQLRLGVHHDRPVPRHRFLERSSRHEKKSDPLIARQHGNLVAAIEQDQRPIAGVVVDHVVVGAGTRVVSQHRTGR
jgi:hypothetical protein